MKSYPKPLGLMPLGSFAERRLNRRDFMKSAAALGVASSLASTWAAPGAFAAEPKKGGHLRIGFGSGSTTDTLDPATFDSNFNQTLGYGTLRSSLTEVDNLNKLSSELAESWEASDDAATWYFKLRKGVEFHNGKTLTADDVIASLNHHRGEESKSGAKSLLADVTEIRADGPDGLVVQLSAGNADFPFYMTDYHFAILPSEDGKVDWKSGIGTGPYVLENFEPGVRAIAKRNPNYFKEDRAHFDSVEYLAIIDVAARTNALTTGEVDIINRADLKTVHLLGRRPGIEVLEVNGTQHYVMPMNTTVAPFNDNHVRLALKFAVDREELLQKILNGYGKVGNDHPIAPATRFYADDLEQRVYDPDKAKFHMKKAGLDSLKVDLHAADAAFAGALDTAVIYQENARKAGIDINVVREPNDGYWSNVWMQKPWVMSYWGGRPTADQMFSTAYAAGVPWNESFWDNERFNKLLVEARPLLDEKKRAELYREMQIIVRDEGGTVVPIYASYVGAYSDKLQHGPVGGNYDFDGFKIAERWWMA